MAAAVMAPKGVDELGEAAPQSGEVRGVIRPPPVVRERIDKTAQFVAQHGKSFESRIMSSEQGQSQKFAFMKATDPYNAYYEQKIREYEENGGQTTVVETTVAEPTVEAPTAVATQKKASMTAPLARALQGVDTSVAPKPLMASSEQPSAVTSAADGEIIKLTAQYTAASGRQFLAGLAQREQKNPQFDFLKPTHVLFSYFTSLVDAYTKILAPTAELAQELERCSVREHCLRRCTHRWDFARRTDEAERREKAKRDAERVAFQSVDWHDFVVVDTIDFPAEELAVPDQPPPPVAEEREIAPPGLPPRDDDIKIVSDYAPRVASAADRSGPTTMVDPLTGNVVPIDRMSEHMRIQLLDPKWRDDQRRQDRQSGVNVAAGDQIAQSLSAFARQRNDIFGSTEEEEAALLEEQRLAKNKADDEHGRIIWDGHGSSINRVQAKVLGILADQAAPPALQAPPGLGSSVAPKPRDDQPPAFPPTFNNAPPFTAAPVIPSVVGTAPPAAVPPPPPPPPPPPALRPPDGAEPQPKRPRVDPETGLVSEADFAALLGDAKQAINVNTPVDDSNAAWGLKGQTLTVDCKVTDNVRALKLALPPYSATCPPASNNSDIPPSASSKTPSPSPTSTSRPATPLTSGFAAADRGLAAAQVLVASGVRNALILTTCCRPDCGRRPWPASPSTLRAPPRAAAGGRTSPGLLQYNSRVIIYYYLFFWYLILYHSSS